MLKCEEQNFQDKLYMISPYQGQILDKHYNN
jgi:hypothetical protein